MKEFLLSLLQAVIIAAVPVITAYLCSFLNQKKKEVTANISDESAKKLISEACDAVVTAVTATNQTYVDTLKRQGTFTVENQKEAFEKSYNTAVAIMSDEAKEFINTAYGSLQEWLTVKIEAQVKEAKS